MKSMRSLTQARFLCLGSCFLLLAFTGTASANPCPLPEDDAALLDLIWPLVDANSDGSLSLGELQQLYPLESSYFDLVDSNRDGQITRAEVTVLLPLLSSLLGGNLLSLVDANGDALIQYGEVSEFVSQAQFDALDSNANGVIDCEDIGDLPPGEGEEEGEEPEEGEMSPEGEAGALCPLPRELSALLDIVWPVVDVDGSGGISLAEIEAVLPSDLELPMDLESLFQVADSNSDGEVQRSEIQVFLPMLEGEELLSYIDENGDGVIAYAEVAGYVSDAQFGQLDLNENGFIDCEDMPIVEPPEGEVIEEGEIYPEGELLGLCPLPREIGVLVDIVWPVVDVDGSGGISLAEIEAVLPIDLELPMDLENLFTLADSNRDGEVQRAEIQVYIPLLEGEDLLSYIDGNGDGVIAYAEVADFASEAQFAQLDQNANGYIDCEDVPLIEPQEGEISEEGEGFSDLPCPIELDYESFVSLLFLLLDLDADGFLVLAEVEGLAASFGDEATDLFQYLDPNEDERISPLEVLNALQLVLYPMGGGSGNGQEKLLPLEPPLYGVDTNRDQLIQYEEVSDFVGPEHFSLIDANANDVIDCEDLPPLDLEEGEVEEGESICPLPTDAEALVYLAFPFGDRDESGGISMEEAEWWIPSNYVLPLELRQIFQIGDANQDGELSLEEVRPYLPLLASVDLLGYVDLNDDDLLDFREMSVYLNEAQFALLDTNQNGLLDCEDGDGVIPGEGEGEGEGEEEGELNGTCPIPNNPELLLGILWPIVDVNRDGGISLEEIQLWAPTLDQSIFALADADRNGLVTREEIMVLVPLLGPDPIAYIDSDGNGVIEFSEVSAYLTAAQFALLDEDANGVLDCYDFGADMPEGEFPFEGEILYEGEISVEGEIGVEGELPPAPEDLIPFLWDLFPLLDENADGALTPAELAAFFQVPVTVFEQLDLNGDGRITHEEASQLLDEDGGFSGQGARLELQRRVQGNGFYAVGETLEVTVTIRKQGSATLGALGLAETLPEGWIVSAVDEVAGAEVAPEVGDGGELSFAWLVMPAFPVTLRYSIEPAATAQGIQVIYGEALYRLEAGEERSSGIIATPLGQGVGAQAVHSADYDQDWAISLSEILRVIQFFNMDGYHCGDLDSEDGYAPGPGAQACTPHDADYLDGSDWAINLSELLRIIQFFNAPQDVYHVLDGTEDGFAPGAFSLE